MSTIADVPFSSYDGLLMCLSVFVTKQSHLETDFLVGFPDGQSLSTPWSSVLSHLNLGQRPELFLRSHIILYKWHIHGPELQEPGLKFFHWRLL